MVIGGIVEVDGFGGVNGFDEGNGGFCGVRDSFERG